MNENTNEVTLLDMEVAIFSAARQLGIETKSLGIKQVCDAIFDLGRGKSSAPETMTAEEAAKPSSLPELWIEAADYPGHFYLNEKSTTMTAEQASKPYCEQCNDKGCASCNDEIYYRQEEIYQHGKRVQSNPLLHDEELEHWTRIPKSELERLKAENEALKARVQQLETELLAYEKNNNTRYVLRRNV